jgi:hypothetical protein
MFDLMNYDISISAPMDFVSKSSHFPSIDLTVFSTRQKYCPTAKPILPIYQTQEFIDVIYRTTLKVIKLDRRIYRISKINHGIGIGPNRPIDENRKLHP